ncbi:MAG TPA: SIMPL domain-containing protein [Methylibium sp.]|nr:SIMPL domain-containing protein [Methylibium sp.]
MTALQRRALSLFVLVAAGALSAAAPVRAAAEARPENLVNFSANASVEVMQDLLSITLQAVREGQDAAQVQAQLKAVLDAALTEARKAAQPGALEVRTGGFSLYPRYGKDGRINGWQGQAELMLQGKDGQRVAQTAGRLSAMNITGVGYSVSRELADKHEAEVTAQAIQKYRARAGELARQFGFAGYTLREVAVQSGAEGGGPRPVMMRAAKAEMAAADAPLPVEPGKSLVSASVSGTVQLMK